MIIPDPAGNPGDEIIRRGILAILEGNLGVTFLDYYCFESPDPARSARNERNLRARFDVLVVCGTPWLWDRCTRSRKYRELTQLIECNPTAQLIALGIGACVPFHCDAQLICADPAVVADLKAIWSRFALITTRDRIASEVLTTCAVPHVADYCPSTLAFPRTSAVARRQKSRRGALVFYLPQVGISRESLPSPFLDHYVDMQIALARRKRLDLACLLPAEREYLAHRLGVDLEAVELLKSASDILRFVADRPLVITGRVHVAIPTHVGGGTACLMPVDSRYLTAVPVGVRILWRYGQYFPAAQLQPRRLRSLFREIRTRDLLLPLVSSSILHRQPDVAAFQERMGQLLVSVSAQFPAAQLPEPSTCLASEPTPTSGDQTP